MKIKVTGYYDTDDFDENDVDLDAESGLTDDAYMDTYDGLSEHLSDIEFVPVED